MADRAAQPDPATQTEPVIWADGVPRSPRFDDPYYSLLDGLAETRHVFLAGNALPARLRDGFAIAELGFGTGLNALATVAAWQESGRAGRFTFTSFEAFPLSAVDLAQAHARWPALGLFSEQLCDQWADRDEMQIGPMTLRVIEGDANATVPAWDGMADAWYLDGFAPARNPDMWSETVLTGVARKTAPGGTFATYTAASAVRHRLEAAGFTVTRAPGFGQKRHMTTGQLP